MDSNNNQNVIANYTNTCEGMTISDDLLKKLRSTKDVPFPYSAIFARYPYFNTIQSILYPHIMGSNDNLVVSSPTGSGKTLLFELAMVNLLQKTKTTDVYPYIMVYIAPIKALCTERFQDWHAKFASLDIKCISVTGDSHEIECDTDYLCTHDIIITTPEKWDKISRRYKENKKLISLVKLFMIDEIHLINDETRGSALEAIVSRMKITQNYFNTSIPIRFIALSATIPNIEDVSDWIGTSKNPAKYFRFGEDIRPVKLKKIVLGYPYNPQMSSPFKFDIMLSYKLQNIIMQYSDGKPTLIFCSTRKSTEMTAKQVVQQLTINLSGDQKKVLAETVSQIYDKNLKETLIHGVGVHHAGITREDRDILQNIFRNGNLPVLIATSTLAMGINLPAHLVVIKSTKYYMKGEYRDHSESTILQMIGRAGRPQYDTNATAVIMTTVTDKHKYENMVGGSQPIESSLHKNLIEHLNAEVVLHTITDLSLAVEWLASTFLYIRAKKNPKYYGLPYGLDSKQLDNKLLELCQIEINKLAKEGMLVLDENVTIKPIRNGYLMAKYCVHFQTFKLFREITGKEILQQLLSLISKSHEYSELYLRTNDKKCLNVLNHCRDRETIRFPLSGKIKTLDMKINCLIQAVLGSLPILESSLITEAQKIIRTGERVTNCLIEYLENVPNSFSALLSTVILNKCLRAQLWENSIYITKQLPKIGVMLSKHLADSGRKTFDDLLEANPRDLERVLNRKAPFGSDLQELVKRIPKYKLELMFAEENGTKSVSLYVTLTNADDLNEKMTVDKNSYMILIVGDDENNILHYVKYKHSYMKENVDIAIAMDLHDEKIAEIKAHFISDDWVGIDCQEVLVLQERKDNNNNNGSPVKKCVAKSQKNATKKNEIRKNQGPSKVQQFMDLYFKTKKRVKAPKTNKTVPKKTIQRTISQLVRENEKKKSEIKAQTFLSRIEKNNQETYVDEAKSLVNDNQTNNLLNDDKDAKNDTAFNSKISDFEINLLSPPQTNVLKEFQYVQHSKLNHATDTNNSKNSLNPDSTTVTKTSPIEVEAVPKTLRWKSPLVSYQDAPKMIESSPLPKTITDKNLILGSKVIKNLPNIKPPSLTNTIVRVNSENFKNNFPLSDEQCNEKVEKISKRPIEEFVSLKLLEELGLSNLNDKSTSKNSQVPTSSSNSVVKQVQDTTEYYSLLEPTSKLAVLQNAIDSIEKSNIEEEKLTAKADTTTHINQLDDSNKSGHSDVSSDVSANKYEVIVGNGDSTSREAPIKKRTFDTTFISRSNLNSSIDIKKNKLDASDIRFDFVTNTRQANSSNVNPFALPKPLSIPSTSKSQQQESSFSNRSLYFVSRGEQQKNVTSQLLPPSSNTHTSLHKNNFTPLSNRNEKDNSSANTIKSSTFDFGNSIGGAISNYNLDRNASLSLFDEKEELDMNELNTSIFDYTPSRLNFTQEVNCNEGFSGNVVKNHPNVPFSNWSSASSTNFQNTNNANTMIGGTFNSFGNKHLINNNITSPNDGFNNNSCGECRCCNVWRSAFNTPNYGNTGIPTNSCPNLFMQQQNDFHCNRNQYFQNAMGNNQVHSNHNRPATMNRLPYSFNTQQVSENVGFNRPRFPQSFPNNVPPDNNIGLDPTANFQRWLMMQKMNYQSFNQN